MKKIIFLIIIFVLLVIAGCKYQQLKDLNICGDGTCTLTEDCRTCPSDCACSSDESCDSFGVCRKAVCGDEICSEEEKSSNSCCEDCGCEDGKICNKVIQKCQEKIEVNEEIIENIVNKYLSENKIEGKIKKTIDAYYKEQIIKKVTIDCGKKELPYPCEIILFINEKGEIVEEVRTV
ncbi:MAG: hypothetical protein KKF52_02645 [Nanoarchaeota archaeon]|nr:hypothetical protein [Nanoarchaeota archaeon]